uniref:Uncharacterized protein n=1 Tax=Panagrolaimus davidi TaxID=227884 RepID=A0A914Q891_9BILA
MHISSTLSLSFLLCFSLLVSDSIVYGKPDASDFKILQQLILSGANEVETSGVGKCTDKQIKKDIEDKCSSADNCSELQDTFNCVVGVYRKDCGKNIAAKFCDMMNGILNQLGNPCHLKCTVAKQID